MKLQVDEPRPFRLTSPATVEEAVKVWHDNRGEAVYLAGGET
jgi:CO/xanthine dehydrogenase FAD-binding subunit